LHTTWPAGQQLEFTQERPAGQMIPQPPQLFGSLMVSTQKPLLHGPWPAGQQLPFWQGYWAPVGLFGHTSPQKPQLFWSVE